MCTKNDISLFSQQPVTLEVDDDADGNLANPVTKTQVFIAIRSAFSDRAKYPIIDDIDLNEQILNEIGLFKIKVQSKKGIGLVNFWLVSKTFVTDQGESC